MNASITWSDLWASFSVMNDKDKAFTWNQLELENLLAGLSAKYQKEVLKDAPEEIKNIVKNYSCLHFETRMMLGSGSQEYENVSASLLRMIGG